MILYLRLHYSLHRTVIDHILSHFTPVSIVEPNLTFNKVQQLIFVQDSSAANVVLLRISLLSCLYGTTLHNCLFIEGKSGYDSKYSDSGLHHRSTDPRFVHQFSSI